ncbi:MAG: hypothetical protein H6730_16435 [Deltaproteobacteria bacterium]|nr:hypothetical protein [Deltaproteobacteria bacterium]
MVGLLAGPARAGDADGQFVVKVGTVAPDGTPWSELMKPRVKKRFWEESADKISALKVYLGGRLGGEKAMARETRRGRIQLFGGSTAALATIVPELYDARGAVPVRSPPGGGLRARPVRQAARRARAPREGGLQVLPVLREQLARPRAEEASA